MTTVRTSLSILSHRAFRNAWLAYTVSFAGDRFLAVAAAFAALESGGSASAVGLLLAALYGPQAVLVLVGGAYADRYPRRLVMVVSDLVRVGTQGCGAVLLLSGQARLWELLVLGCVYGGAAAFFEPASVGLLADIVPKDRLQQANALTRISKSVVAVAAPAAAGALVVGAGAGGAYAVDALSFAISAALLVRVVGPVRRRVTGERLIGQLAEGWTELRARPWVWVSIAYFSLFTFLVAPWWVLGPVMVSERLGGSEEWGFIIAAAAVGSFAGGVVALRARPRRPLSTSYLCLGTLGIQMLTLSVPMPALVIAGAAALGGAALTFASTLWFTLLQQRIPTEVISRISAYDWAGTLLLQPLGYAASGPAAAWLGTQATLAFCGVAVLAASVAVACTTPIRAIQRENPSRSQTCS